MRKSKEHTTLYKGWENKPKKKRRKILIISIILGLFLLLIIGNINYVAKTTGRVVEDIEASEQEIAIAEKIADNELVSNVDVREKVDVEVKKSLFKNKVIEFNTEDEQITLDFDLLDYGEWVDTDVEDEVDAENFDIQVDESSEKYKWGYDVKLNDLEFMAKIDVSSDNEIVIIDNQTLRIGKNYLSFADLVDEGYVVRVENPVVLDEVELINITDINITEINVSITDVNVSIETNISIVNVTGVNESIGDIEVNISEEDDEGDDIEVNETEIIIEVNITESEGEESEEGGEPALGGAEEPTEEDEEDAEEVIVEEEPAEEEPEGVVEITGGVIRTITGFVINGIRGITGLAIAEENKVSIYIERDFTNTTYSVGDIINLDPYLIIIEIIKAQHLSENRVFIEDIYDDVQAKDNNWSKVINNNEYVRVRFEEMLDNTKDITIYARSSDESPAEIEVYREDDDEIIAKFENIISEDLYKIYLTELSEDETQDIFDLKVLGSVEFDYIVDPTIPKAYDGSDNVYRCGYIENSGNYQMDRNIINNTLTDACIKIIEQDVNLDCAGYYIQSDDGYAGVWAGSSDYNYNQDVEDVRIENCNISMDDDPSVSEADFSDTGVGILLAAVDNFEIYNSTFIDQSVGIYFEDSDYGRIENVTLGKSLYDNILIVSSTYNNLTNITINGLDSASYDNHGIHLVKGSNNNVLTDIIVNNTRESFYLESGPSDIGSNNNLFRNIIAQTDSDDAFKIRNSKNNYIIDSYFNSSHLNRKDVDISGGSTTPATSNVFLNVSFDSSYVGSNVYSELIRKWYYQANVRDSGGNLADNTEVNLYNSDGDLVLSLTTNASGRTEIGNIIDYVETNGALTYYSNYSIYALNSSGSWGSVDYNATEGGNNFNHSITLTSLGLVSACGELSSANTVYTQMGDIIDNSLPSGGCFKITAENITLDCNGFSIVSSDREPGVYSNQVNTTIKNCEISTGYAVGIFLSYANNSYIFNNILTPYTGQNYGRGGIYIGRTYNAKIEQNTFSGAGVGIGLSVSDNNNLTNNNMGSTTGFVLSGASHNLIFDTSISSSGSVVRSINSAINNSFINVTYDATKESITGGSELSRKWYYKAHVVDTGDNDIENASVQMFNSTGGLTLNLTTNASGWTEIGYALEYSNSGGTRNYAGKQGLATRKNSTSKLKDEHRWDTTVKLNNFTDLFILELDNDPPVFSSPDYSATPNAATIIWSTDELANSSVTYWASPSNTSGQSGYVTSHSVLLSPLAPETSYSYNYTSCDFVDNCDGSSTFGFTTPEVGEIPFSGGQIILCGWDCTWSECVDGIRTASNCNELNGCPGPPYYPVMPEVEGCGVDVDVKTPGSQVDQGFPSSPDSKFFCECSDWGEWGTCEAVYNLDVITEESVLLEGKQERSCQDNKCEKYGEQDCDLQIPIYAAQVEKCSKDYVEVFDEQDVLISRMELVEGFLEQLNVEFLFGDSAFCCLDGEKNYDEDEVDCTYSGAGCDSCYGELATLNPSYYVYLSIILFMGILKLIVLIWYIKVLRRNKRKLKRIFKLGFLDGGKEFFSRKRRRKSIFRHTRFLKRRLRKHARASRKRKRVLRRKIRKLEKKNVRSERARDNGERARRKIIEKQRVREEKSRINRERARASKERARRLREKKIHEVEKRNHRKEEIRRLREKKTHEIKNKKAERSRFLKYNKMSFKQKESFVRDMNVFEKGVSRLEEIKKELGKVKNKKKAEKIKPKMHDVGKIPEIEEEIRRGRKK